MVHFRKRLYLVITVSLAITTIMFFCHKKIHLSITPAVKKNLCRGIPARNTITPLKDKRTFIIAPYFDNRQNNMTRVIAIVHHKEVKELYCWFCHPSSGEIYISKAEINVHSDRFDFPYGATDLRCLEPGAWEPHYVSIHWSLSGDPDQLPLFEIRNRDREGPLVNFTVCISTMFGGYNNVLQFVQSMEMYKILGVDRVMIYKNSCSPLMEKVLDFYIAEGIVEIIPWPIDSYLSVASRWHHSVDPKDIGYYGQITALNDCIYRNMYRSRYLLMNDIDEIILPVKYRDWNTMMQNLQMQHPKAAAFSFENHIFPKNVFSLNDPFNISSWRTVPGVNILQHILREPDRKNIINPFKMIVDPRKVVQTSVHSVLQTFGDSVHVSMDVALVYHCRIPLQPQLPRKSLINDTTLWSYNVTLVRNVSKVLRQIGL
ncbi:beta-1,4-galactosyltransferase galt-1-like [Sphaerodactylus townsendi]|uniref:beta-1,4-galactosyltransferase galt-1-like n=1 Tax=Sphaerodactylus townsendi TaxID=933632 RepID=UPI002025BF64|nr:beta-1,4-galactosyltransferase galt-1-like [Sphaerodactylus townsendi]